MSLVQQAKPILPNFEVFQLNTEFMQKKLIGDFFEAQLGILNRNWTPRGFPQFGFHMSHIHHSSVQHTNHHGYAITECDSALMQATYNTTSFTVFAGYKFECL
jgi:hypothetical protein